MTTRRIHDNTLFELKSRVAALEEQVKQTRNNPVVTLPIRDNANLPLQANEGDAVIGEDGKAYKYLFGEWTPIGGTGTFIDVVTTPGKLSVFQGVTRSYQNESGQISLIHASVGIPSGGNSVDVTINKNGASIADCSIPAGEYFGTFVPPTPIPFVAGDYFTQDITQVGSPGSRGNTLVVKLF